MIKKSPQSSVPVPNTGNKKFNWRPLRSEANANVPNPCFAVSSASSSTEQPITSSRLEADDREQNRLSFATKNATKPETVADPDLAAANAAWPTLPEALKAGILAMVKAASK
jgi:hypothetical protein